jgi:hypothetical protein
MRAALLFVVVLPLAACDSYDEDLGPTPFLCGPDDACPAGYACADDQANGRRVCVSSDDSIPSEFDCNDDSDLEPNDVLAMAAMTPIDVMKSYSLDGRAICPATDKDTYAVMISTTNENLDAQITFQAGGAALRAAILNTGGVPIATAAAVAGEPTTLRAFARNLPSGLYYVQVSSTLAGSLAVNNYKLELAVSGP